jgi:hypothetical protein
MKKLLLPASIVLLVVAACCAPKNGAESNASQTENSKEVAPNDNQEAPPHHAPNQAEIDSLKIERAKEKKGMNEDNDQ